MVNVSGAHAGYTEDIEDRAEAVRRALGGLAGSKKNNFGFGNSSQKAPMSKPSPSPMVSAPMSQPMQSSVSQPMQSSVPRIPLQNTSNTLSRNQSKDTAQKVPALGFSNPT